MQPYPEKRAPTIGIDTSLSSSFILLYVEFLLSIAPVYFVFSVNIAHFSSAITAIFLSAHLPRNL